MKDLQVVEERPKLKADGSKDGEEKELRLVQDPRSSAWKGAIFGKELRRFGNRVDRLPAGIRQRLMWVEEVLNRCWGEHEFASDYGEEIIDWLREAANEREGGSGGVGGTMGAPGGGGRTAREL